MSRRYGGPGGQKMVPLEVAQELLEQRDELVAQVQRLRRRCDQLERQSEAMEDTHKRLKEQVAALGEENEVWRQRAEEEERSGKAEEASSEPLGHQQRELYERRLTRLNEDLKRLRNQQGEAVETARTEERRRLLGGLTEVLDGVDRAIDMIDEDSPWRQGLEAIQRQFVAFLKGEGARSVGERGEKLDPRVHEAVMVVESDEVKPGHIVEVKRPGLVLEDGTVVRSAQVVVGKKTG